MDNPGAETGVVDVPQMFGGSLNVHPHRHTVSADGVFEKTGEGGVRFHEDPPPSPDDVAQVARRARDRAVRWLGRKGMSTGVRPRNGATRRSLDGGMSWAMSQTNVHVTDFSNIPPGTEILVQYNTTIKNVTSTWSGSVPLIVR